MPEQRNKKILDAVRAHNFKDLIACLKGIDQELVRGAIAGEHFAELFSPTQRMSRHRVCARALG